MQAVLRAEWHGEDFREVLLREDFLVLETVESLPGTSREIFSAGVDRSVTSNKASTGGR